MSRGPDQAFATLVIVEHLPARFGGDQRFSGVEVRHKRGQFARRDVPTALRVAVTVVDPRIASPALAGVIYRFVIVSPDLVLLGELDRRVATRSDSSQLSTERPLGLMYLFLLSNRCNSATPPVNLIVLPM